MPSIPGLKEWVQRLPNLVRHSRQYRRAEAYADQTVLIVGASVRHPLVLCLPLTRQSRLVGLKYLEI